MKKISPFILILFVVLSSFCVKAQDLIYKTNKEIIVCKIIETGVSEIKYKEFSDLNGLVYAIDK